MIEENVGGMQVNLKELNARERKGYQRPKLTLRLPTPTLGPMRDQGVIDRIDTAHLSGDS